MNTQQLLADIQSRTKWSQEELARKLSVSFATLNSWINGHSTPRQTAKANIAALHDDPGVEYLAVFEGREYGPKVTPDIAKQLFPFAAINFSEIDGK